MKTYQEAKGSTVKNVANACLASCQKLAAQIERAKRKLLAEFEDTLEAPDQLFRLALGEAEALAWQTGYPHLVFPTLAAEKVQAVAAWHRRQNALTHHSSRARLAA